jgi:hypothetical protein
MRTKFKVMADVIIDSIGSIIGAGGRYRQWQLIYQIL